MLNALLPLYFIIKPHKMHTNRLLSFILILSCFQFINATPPKPPVGFRWVLQEDFSDEFNGKRLDRKKWYNYYPGWQGRPPAMFKKSAVDVKDGNLQIKSGVLRRPKGPFRIYGGAVQTKKQAHYGYYECRAKASQIEMSTTFWMSNGKVSFTETDCTNDAYSQELDIQECIGNATTQEKFRNGMNCNTHFRYIKCDERRETFFSKGAGAILDSEVWEEYHTYAAWWKNPDEVYFYADNQFFAKVKVTKEIKDKPFSRPMHINMVTETYDWQPAPSDEDVSNDSINVAFYDWIRSYKLVAIDEEYTHIETEVEVYKNTLVLNKVPETIAGLSKLDFECSVSCNEDLPLRFKLIEGKNTIITKLESSAKHGHSTQAQSLPIAFSPSEGKHYKIVAELMSSDSAKVIKRAAFDVSL